MRLVLILLILSVISGCAWTPKPYASDPLVRTRKALPGDPLTEPSVKPLELPQPPAPPDALERLAET